MLLPARSAMARRGWITSEQGTCRRRRGGSPARTGPRPLSPYRVPMSDPQTLNLYSYARNKPLTITDPDGHCPWCFGAVVGGVGGAAASYRSQRSSNPDKPVNWKSVIAAGAGGFVAGGTLGLATAPAALTRIGGHDLTRNWSSGQGDSRRDDGCRRRDCLAGHRKQRRSQDHHRPGYRGRHRCRPRCSRPRPEQRSRTPG
jgi:hypothetical protein